MTKPEQLLERAWNLLEDGDVDGARSAVEPLRDDPEARPDALLVIAACFREAGEMERAIETLREAQESDPDWAMPSLWTAEILATEPGRVEEALALAARAVDLADEEDVYLDALALKAGIEVGLERMAEARSTLADAPPPGEADVPPPIAREFAHLFLAVGDAASSRERFEALIADDATDADAWHGLGFAADALGDAAARDRAWLETLSLDMAADDDMGGDAFTDGEVTERGAQGITALPRRARTWLAGVPLKSVAYPSVEEVRAGHDPRHVVRIALGDGAGSAPIEVIFYRKSIERECDDPEALPDELTEALLREVESVLGPEADA